MGNKGKQWKQLWQKINKENKNMRANATDLYLSRAIIVMA